MVQLVWICFIGGGKFANACVGFLQIDVDQRGNATETKTFAGRSGLDVGEKLSGCLVGGLHLKNFQCVVGDDRS